MTTAALDKYTVEKVQLRRLWAPHLISFRLSRSAQFAFRAGQFARLGIIARSGTRESAVWRPYSIVSGQAAPYLEFFSVLVPGGEFTQHLAGLRDGDEMLVEKAPYGFLTTERIVKGGDLWMISTGTGLAPFISMLSDPALWRDYQNLILVHSVRSACELAYVHEINELNAENTLEGGARLHYVPIVTREKNLDGMLHARIPELIDAGVLEAKTGSSLVPSQARVLLCGNPDMVTTVRGQLSARQFKPARRGELGTLAVENYW
jgi:ferredoxin--NADP+ reductase